MSDQPPLMPDQCARRSLAWRAWATQQSKTGDLVAMGDGVLVERAGHQDNVLAERCGLIDLTVLDRYGFRGARAASHLQTMGLPVPAQANQASVSDRGDIVLRLGAREFWVLATTADQSQRLNWPSQVPRPPADCYSLYCQHSHAWLLLTGQHRASTLAKLCAVDLRSSVFPVGSVAQTSVARSNVILVHHPWGQQKVFSLLCDSASTDYLWGALLDAMTEFDGGPIGLNALE